MSDVKSVLLQLFPNFCDKKFNLLTQSETLARRDKSASDGGITNENMSYQQLAEELHKTTIRKFKKGKVYSTFIDNIWGVDVADMQFISNF